MYILTLLFCFILLFLLLVLYKLDKEKSILLLFLCLKGIVPMEGGGVRCLSPQNTFRFSGVNSVAAKSNTNEVTADRFFKLFSCGPVFMCVSGRILFSRWQFSSWMWVSGFFVFFVLRIVHHLLHLCWIWLHHCLPLKLRKCFVDSYTSPTPPSA